MKKTLNLLKYPSFIFLSYLIGFKGVDLFYKIGGIVMFIWFIFTISLPGLVFPYLFYAQAKQSALCGNNFFIPLIMSLIVFSFLVVNPDLKLGFEWYHWSDLFEPSTYLWYLWYTIIYSITYFITKQKLNEVV